MPLHRLRLLAAGDGSAVVEVDVEGPYRIPKVALTIDGRRWLRVQPVPRRPEERWVYVPFDSSDPDGGLR